MKLALFFTFEVSLRTWRDAGILDRELLLYKKLAEEGVRTTLFTFGDKNDSSLLGSTGSNFTVVPLFADGAEGSWKRFFASWVVPFRLRRQLRDFEVVKTNQMWGSWTGLVSKLFLRRKWLLRCGFEHHRFLMMMGASIRDRLFSLLYSRLAYRLADRVVWSNRADMVWACEKFGLRENDERFYIIPNYVDTELFKPPENRLPGKRVVTVTRLDRQKNLSSLIRALAGSGYELEIIGEGPQRDYLENLARENGVRISLPGVLPQRQLPSRLQDSRIFVLPSLYEGMPKSLIEAMSSGMAVMGTDVPGIRELLKHEHNGLLCGTDPKSIRLAINRLTADPDFAFKLGRNARRYAVENFSLQKVVNKELALLRDMAG